MKEALDGVRADAAMMRSPSFSREGESRTMTNSSLAGGVSEGHGWEGGIGDVTECLYHIWYRVEGGMCGCGIRQSVRGAVDGG
jgi:hypothetical protein